MLQLEMMQKWTDASSEPQFNNYNCNLNVGTFVMEHGKLVLDQIRTTICHGWRDYVMPKSDDNGNIPY
jgi:hypothetical protein